MYLKRIYLKDIRSFAEIDIDLSSNTGGVKSWAVIFGENGVGKTTILRSIGLILGDPESAGGLLREVPGDWVREGSSEKTAVVRAEFVEELSRECSSEYSIELHISSKRDREAIHPVQVPSLLTFLGTKYLYLDTEPTEVHLHHKLTTGTERSIQFTPCSATTCRFKILNSLYDASRTKDMMLKSY